MPEQFTLDQRFGKCAAIDGNEGTLNTLTQGVYQARNQFFTGAAFAGHQYAGVTGCDQPDAFQQNFRIRVLEGERLGANRYGMRGGIGET